MDKFKKLSKEQEGLLLDSFDAMWVTQIGYYAILAIVLIGLGASVIALTRPHDPFVVATLYVSALIPLIIIWLFRVLDHTRECRLILTHRDYTYEVHKDYVLHTFRSLPKEKRPSRFVCERAYYVEVVENGYIAELTPRQYHRLKKNPEPILLFWLVNNDILDKAEMSLSELKEVAGAYFVAIESKIK